jgi:hypothetical protein
VSLPFAIPQTQVFLRLGNAKILCCHLKFERVKECSLIDTVEVVEKSITNIIVKCKGINKVQIFKLIPFYL